MDNKYTSKEVSFLSSSARNFKSSIVTNVTPFQNQFIVDDVSKIIKEAIEQTIGGNAYQHDKVNNWTGQVVENCLSVLTKQQKPYKYIGKFSWRRSEDESPSALNYVTYHRVYLLYAINLQIVTNFSMENFPQLSKPYISWIDSWLQIS